MQHFCRFSDVSKWFWCYFSFILPFKYSFTLHFSSALPQPHCELSVSSQKFCIRNSDQFSFVRRGGWGLLSLSAFCWLCYLSFLLRFLGMVVISCGERQCWQRPKAAHTCSCKPEVPGDSDVVEYSGSSVYLAEVFRVPILAQTCN
jgi:hypothetical protein